MKRPLEPWDRIRAAGPLRCVLYIGCLQFGLIATALFIVFSAIRGEPDLFGQSLRALIGFELAGIPFGLAFWLVARLFGRET